MRALLLQVERLTQMMKQIKLNLGVLLMDTRVYHSLWLMVLIFGTFWFPLVNKQRDVLLKGSITTYPERFWGLTCHENQSLNIDWWYFFECSVTAATRFQRSFIQLLDSAGFEELSARDLALTSALNTDYLLTLPVYVDWNKASESNAIVFRFNLISLLMRLYILLSSFEYCKPLLLPSWVCVRTFSNFLVSAVGFVVQIYLLIVERISGFMFSLQTLASCRIICLWINLFIGVDMQLRSRRVCCLWRS